MDCELGGIELVRFVVEWLVDMRFDVFEIYVVVVDV